MKKQKVALIHDYLTQYGGAEKTLEALIEIFPKADIFTSYYNPQKMSDLINSKNIFYAKKINNLVTFFPIISKYLTFLIPLIFENFNLDSYDLIISDSSSYAKGVLTKPHQLHISYIHTPPRFLYKYSVENTKRNKWYYKWLVVVIDHFLRIWDFNAAQRPDYIIANSKEIQNRIKKFYKRTSTVIYPPVDHLEIKKDINDKKDYYLIAGRMVAYKNFDLVVNAFNQIENLHLVVIGDGPMKASLQKISGNNVEFLGNISDIDKHAIMENCMGLINSVKDEDFGIVPIEVLMHGKPVLAHRSAGHLETIIEGVNGEFFDQLEIEHLKQKIIEFNSNIKDNKYNSATIKASVQKFQKAQFKKDFIEFVKRKQESSNKDA